MPPTKGNPGNAKTTPAGTSNQPGGTSTSVVFQDDGEAICHRIGGIWTPPKNGKSGYCTVPKVAALPPYKINVYRGDPCHRNVFGNEKYILVPYTAKVMSHLKANFKKFK